MKYLPLVALALVLLMLASVLAPILAAHLAQSSVQPESTCFPTHTC